MPIESLIQVLRDTSRPAFLFGSTPPRDDTTVDNAKKSCEKFAVRSAVLAIDGFIVYDIQDEEGRTDLDRPFPFRKTMDSSLYASFFPPLTGKQCVVYKCVANQTEKEFTDWMDNATNEFGHNAFNLVGAATSKVINSGINLPQASVITKRNGRAFGCVCIPERHTSKGNENFNMIRKVDLGCEWFITQGVFAAEPVIRLINSYGDLCRQKNLTPKKVILSFAPCGRPKTMQFIKWLGMAVPESAEKRILESSNPVKESVQLLKEVLVQILLGTGNSGVPLGVNVESLSIFREEIDAAHELFQILQATLLNSRGSPWAVRWFDVRKSLEFTAAHASPEELQQLQQLYTAVSPISSNKYNGFFSNADDNDSSNAVVSMKPTTLILVVTSFFAGILFGRHSITR